MELSNFCELEDVLKIILQDHQQCLSLEISHKYYHLSLLANGQMPPRDTHLQFQKWAKEYGPIYSLMIGTKTLIVLSSDQAVKDLMDKRSNIYSSKPDLYISQDLISGGYRMLFMKYDQQWRMIRKMCHALLNIQAARTYVPYQVLENKQMLHDLLDTPDDFVNHMRRYRCKLCTH